MREFHQRGVKDDPLRITHLGNGFCHTVILCFTAQKVKSEWRTISASLLMAVMSWQGCVFVLFSGFERGFNGFTHLTSVNGTGGNRCLQISTQPRPLWRQKSSFRSCEEAAFIR